MAKNPVVRVISTLERNGITLGIFTNNLAAYDALKELIPPSMHASLISYSTVNRTVKKCGDLYNIPTPIGIFVIAKHPLFRFHETSKNKDIAGG
jgi:hypothetical protein